MANYPQQANTDTNGEPKAVPSTKQLRFAAFLSLLRYDLGILNRSVVIRFWFLLTLVGASTAVLVSRNYIDPTSFFMSWALALYAGLGSFVTLVISVSAISAERAFLGVTIISRGIAPTPYVLAKLTSRCLYILGMFLLVVTPTMFLVQAQGLNNDMVTSGILLALLYWSLLLTVLVLLGITASVLFNNTLFGLVVLGSFWYIGLVTLTLTYAGGLTPQGVLGNLPLLLQGHSKPIEIYAILLIGIIPTLTLPFLAVRLFNSRDL